MKLGTLLISVSIGAAIVLWMANHGIGGFPIVLTYTRYAPNYSGKRFDEIKPGVRTDVIRNSLGEPFKVAKYEGVVVWYYSRGKDNWWTGKYFQAREVVFSNEVVCYTSKYRGF